MGACMPAGQAWTSPALLGNHFGTSSACGAARCGHMSPPLPCPHATVGVLCASGALVRTWACCCKVFCWRVPSSAASRLARQAAREEPAGAVAARRTPGALKAPRVSSAPRMPWVRARGAELPARAEHPAAVGGVRGPGGRRRGVCGAGPAVPWRRPLRRQPQGRDVLAHVPVRAPAAPCRLPDGWGVRTDAYHPTPTLAYPRPRPRRPSHRGDVHAC